MSINKRDGNKWTINEVLALQREYELLEWPVYKIAKKHQRTTMSILCKLQAENFISSFKEARGFDIDAYSNTTDELYTLQEDKCLEEKIYVENDNLHLQTVANKNSYIFEKIVAFGIWIFYFTLRVIYIYHLFSFKTPIS
jgi:hypothetical protein